MAYPFLTKDDAIQCGMGQRDLCCAYLVAGPNGFECGRVNDDLNQLINERVSAGQMSAQRLPTEPYPDCQRSET